jgi:hypothetical protein
MLGLLALTVLAVVAWPQGEEAKHTEKLRMATERLHRGEAVTLVNEGGRPVSYRVRAGVEYTKVFDDPGMPFSADAGRPALIEFLKSTGTNHYKIVAEVRQDGFLADAYAGLYYGHQQIDTSEGMGHLFGAIYFSDFGPQSRKATKPGGPTASYARISHFWFIPPGDPVGELNQYTGTNLSYSPPGPQAQPPGPWHTISVTIDGNIISATFDGASLPDFKQSGVQTWIGQLPKYRPSLPDHPPQLSLLGGTGLYVHGCKASVRNFQIHPLSPN